MASKSSVANQQEQIVSSQAAELDKLIKLAQTNKATDIINLVEFLSKNKNSKHCELVLEKGIYFAQNYTSQLNSQNLLLIEEFFMAACELKVLDWAEVFLRVARNLHPKSVKSMRMLAMFYEAKGEYMKAQEIYLDMIEQNPADQITVKRLVTFFRDVDMIQQAVTVLNKYLEANQEDIEAWLQLTDLYLQKQNYSKAKFCYEEVLSQQPMNFQVNIRYAEILYSMSQASNADRLEDLLIARKYFCHALIQRENDAVSARALFGLLRTCKSIETVSKKDDPKNKEIMETTQQRIKELYEKKTSLNVSNMASMKQ